MKTALVTGSNKGIGLEIVRQLSNMGFKVFLASRDLENGLEAKNSISDPENNIEVIQLDVSNEESIKECRSYLREGSVKLDVLINNAGILIDDASISNLSSKIFFETISVNTLGPILMIQNFIEFLEDGSRIINVSSGWGSINEMGSSPPAYSISKAALNAVTKQFASELKSRNIAVNSVSPGWVRTDMGGIDAERSPEKGAETIVWLANEAPVSITAKFIRDKKEIAW